MGRVVKTGLPCWSCGSSDAVSQYDDGSLYCFSGNHKGRRDKQNGQQHDEEEEMATATIEDVETLPVAPLLMRGITQEIAQQFGVRVEYGEDGEESVYYFPLYKADKLIGYQAKKARQPGQRQKGDVFRIGETKGTDPFGSVGPREGKFILVTEGGEDALAVAQLCAAKGKRYRVVACLGTESWKKQIQFFAGFKQVAICFDQDDAGKQAAREFAAALRPGQAKLVRWNHAKDPNELLDYEEGPDMFFDALSRAETYKPDGIIWGEDVWHRMENYIRPATIPYPEEWVLLNNMLEGMREAEISLWTGGTSCGKTAYARRLKQHVITTTDWKVGEVELEERGEKTWRGLMQFHAGKRWADMTQEERRGAYEATYGSGRIFTLDHRSQYGRGQSLLSKFKHLHYGLGCRVIFLDHITLAVNEFGDGSGLVAQDQMMNEFLEFVETTGVHLCLISHLRKTGTGGKSFEEGAIPTEDDLKGSGSLKQIAFDTIAVSRNKMHEDEYERNVSQMHVLKSRETGKTGHADKMHWCSDTHSLTKAREPDYEEGDDEHPKF